MTLLRVDWERREVGRLRCSYGATKRENNAFKALLDELYEKNALDVLRALKAGQLTPRDLMAEKRAGRHLELNVLLNVALNKPLWSELDACIQLRHGGEKHKRRMRDSLKKLRASGLLTDRATIADLKHITKAKLRPYFGSEADWNHCRKAILTPLSQLFGDPFHPFRREVLKALGKREKEPERPLSVTVESFWNMVNALPVHAQCSIVTLAVTGLRLDTEFMRTSEKDLRPHIPGVYCPGTKNADASGIVHVAKDLYRWVELGITNRLKSRQTRTHFHMACVKTGLGRWVPDAKGRIGKRWPWKGKLVHHYEGLTLHDLRHLTAIFAYEGGATTNEVQAMMRHSDSSQTMRYARIMDRGKAAEAIGRALERPIERAD